MAHIIQAVPLKALVSQLFAAAGCQEVEARRVAHYLVEANLVGHDSHGVIRAPTYLDWMRDGKVLANQSARIVFENDAIAVVDGQYGLGQTIGEQAVQIGVEKAGRHGVSVVALRNAGHLGRIGDWPIQAAAAGKLSLHFVNTSGAGILVAPFGGISRRLSACPIAAGVPLRGSDPIVLDISMCTIAEGKIRVAFNKGVPVPDGCIIDANGNPTNDPRIFYADPPGAILPIGAHKGYGLAMMTEVLSGALTGGSCSNPANAHRLCNGMLSIYFSPEFFATDEAFQSELERFVAYVKSAEKVTPGGEILVPGEMEQRVRAQRLASGVELDDTTWRQIVAAGERLGVSIAGS